MITCFLSIGSKNKTHFFFTPSLFAFTCVFKYFTHENIFRRDITVESINTCNQDLVVSGRYFNFLESQTVDLYEGIVSSRLSID